MNHRLFFAIWPNQNSVKQIRDVFKHYPWPMHAKPVADVDLHITLSFLGHATRQQYQDLLPIIKEISSEPFDISFDQLVYWSKPDLLLLEASEIPKALQDLVKNLHRALRRQQWKLETREFKPHITLARHFPAPITQAALQLGELKQPVNVHVEEFCLADGALRMLGQAKHYCILKRFKI
jgi:2'-5' RNA ligase